MNIAGGQFSLTLGKGSLIVGNQGCIEWEPKIRLGIVSSRALSVEKNFSYRGHLSNRQWTIHT